MPYDPMTGQWRDETGVPDQGMPPGMGDPTGGIVPQAQATPMAPQQITPRPIVGGPQPQAAATPDYQGQDYMGMKGPGIPEPFSPEQRSEMFGAMTRPEPWSAGKIATTALTAPMKGVAGVLAELYGALGIPTVADSAARVQSLYANPNKSESRAFGVLGNAEEPGFGDRFMGIWDGSARRTEQAGLVMRQIVGARNQARKDAFRENKDILQLQSGQLGIQKGIFDVQNQGRVLDSQLSTAAASRASSQASTAVSRYTLAKKIQDDITVNAVSAALAARPELADGKHNAELMGIAKGNMNLVRQALENNKLGLTMPNAAGIGPEKLYDTGVGIAKDTAQEFVTDKRSEGEKIADAVTQALSEQREDTIRREAQAREDAKAGTVADEKTLERARAQIEATYKDTRSLQIPPAGGFFGTDTQPQLDFIAKLDQEKGRVLDFLSTGRLSPAAASAIASGDQPTIDRMLQSGELDQATYDAVLSGAVAPPPTPSPSPLATPAPLPTTAVPTPRPESELPSMQGANKLTELLGSLFGGKTPTATPTPTPSATPQGMNDNEQRDKLARFTLRFQMEWARLHPNKPMSGPAYESEFKRNAAANHLAVP